MRGSGESVMTRGLEGEMHANDVNGRGQRGEQLRKRNEGCWDPEEEVLTSAEKQDRGGMGRRRDGFWKG